MSSVSTVQGLFKKVYGDLSDITPEGGKMDKAIPFKSKAKVGESYDEAIVLSAETGLSLLGSNAEVLDLQPPVAGAVKQATIKDSGTLLASVIPYQTLSRSASAGEQAFVQASKHVTRNNLKSHKRFIENLMIYGQSASLLGYVEYSTTTFRGVSLTTGTGTINGIAFTNGINAASKAILLGRNFAPSIFVGMEGLPINQLDTNEAIVASGKVVTVEAEYGYITVDFTPIAASSATSHKLAYPGQESQLEMVGVDAILNNAGSLFGISAATYNLWKGTVYNAYQPGTTTPGKLTFAKLNAAVAVGVNRGGLMGDVEVHINPRSWATLLSDEAALRQYTGEMNGGTVKKGAEEIEYYAQNGKIKIVPDTAMKENMALVLHLEDWMRFGSAELSFKVPGADDDLIFPLQNQSGFAFRSFASQCVLCLAPAKSIFIANINDESTT